MVRLPGGDGCLDAQTQRKPYGQRDQEGKKKQRRVASADGREEYGPH